MSVQVENSELVLQIRTYQQRTRKFTLTMQIYEFPGFNKQCFQHLVHYKVFTPVPVVLIVCWTKKRGYLA